MTTTTTPVTTISRFADRLTVVRDEAPDPFIRCPHCAGTIQIPGLDGTEWTVRSPNDIADQLILRFHGLLQEELVVVNLDVKLHVLSTVTVYKGSVSQALVRVSELFREAVRLNAAAILIAHSHPSGDPTPSPDDLHLAAETLAAGKLLDIRVIDALVIAGNTWVSLRDRGIAFSL